MVKYHLRPSSSFLLLVIVFFALNILGAGIALSLSAFILCLCFLFVLSMANKDDEKLVAPQLPVVFYCLGLMVFHFSWGTTLNAEWIDLGVREEYVAYALLAVAGAILATALGVWWGKPPVHNWKSDTLVPNRPWYPLMGVAFVVVGGVAQVWAFQNHLIGFEISAYGVDFSTYGPFVTIILTLQTLVGVGQVTLLVLILDDIKRTRSFLFPRQRLVTVVVLSASFIFDLIIRLQSAARATILIGSVPVLVTLYVYGYRRAVKFAVVVGVAIYATLLYPLVNMMRYDPLYKDTLSEGRVFLPDLEYLTTAHTEDSDAIITSIARMNQTSLLAFSIQRNVQGLPTLDGESYSYALATVIPRLLASDRVDRLVPYDMYTGYYLGSGSYNNWGMHTEAFLNFGFVGIGVIMGIAGFLWQKTYKWLLHFEGPVGWAIIASILLPSIFRAGEYGFQNTIVATLRTLVFVVICVKAVIWGMQLSNERPALAQDARFK